MLNTIERSRLRGLNFVGDKYEFNEIEIILIAINKYLITDKKYNFSIVFGIGDYESIVINTFLMFDNSKGERLNKIATCMTVKDLLEKMSGKLTPNFIIPDLLKFEDFTKIFDSLTKEDKNIFTKLYQIDENKNYYILTKEGQVYENRILIYEILTKIGYEQKEKNIDSTKIEHYNKFIDQLKKVERYEIFNYLKRYIELNFTILLDNNYDSNWINPYDLYYYKKGNYKSIAFFYFYVLKELNFNVKFFIVVEKIKKNKESLIKLSKMNQQEKEKLQILYKYVKPSYNLEELLYYEPPNIEKAKFLVNFENNGKWIYSSGGTWVDDDIYRSERAIANFLGKGCYYSEVKNYNNIVNNIPMREQEFEWDVFYDSK